ncbi:pectate lyase superfamily protein-domain-containing protein [Leptodontidium sp. MPI-SDFR-AT-0119]|nr:pectate lyase superfamily protein-domain-containing protein [Leptodontidium sp. MPI-SDFR-AT-0119]
MALLCFVTFLVGLLFLHPAQLVRAQYLQDYTGQTQAGSFHQTWFYQPRWNDPPVPVFDFNDGPHKISVYLVYNCFYMKDICRNADNFFATPRGQNMHPRSSSGLGPRTFGFDFNNRYRARNRGRHTCPDASATRPWRANHTCLEPDQQTVMRHDGPWFSTALEPGTTTNTKIHDTGPNGQIIPSNVRYSCDEFPPKSFVEGGDGVDLSTPSNTRCAALRCSPAGVFPTVKAEQDWQGLAHGGLRLELIMENNPATFFGFDKTNSIALFNLGMINVQDGIAAKKGITFEDIHEFMTAGHGNETLISAHHSPEEEFSSMVSSFNQMPQMEGMKSPMAWSFDGELDRNNARHCKDHHNEKPRNMHGDGAREAHVATRNVPDSTITPLLKRATPQDLEEAQEIVEKALAESSKLNALRLAQPLRNTYGIKKAAVNNLQVDNSTTNEDVTPLLHITTQIAKAAALVAEADSVVAGGNITKRAVSAGTFLACPQFITSLEAYADLLIGNDPAYKVFRNVLDYGVVGDGITDDTKAIKSAMINGTRCGEKCNGSTTKNAIVYFPPGKYLISTTIAMPFGTQVIGDANLRPTLVASPKFIANFYRQIRNIVIDITQAGANISALHYQVAQATSLQNVELVAKAGSTQIGMYAENGSGGQISDVTFTGGGIGLYGGNQQFTAQRLTFNGCTTGVQVIWDWGWVWKSVKMTNVKIGFRLVSDDGSGNIGSVSILDSSFKNVGTAVVITPPSSAIGSGSTGVVLENVAFSGVSTAIADTAGKTILAGSKSVIGHWALGPIYAGSTTSRSFQQGGKVGNYVRRSTLLDPKGAYFERAKPQYENRPIGDFVHLKDLGALGDGTTDDTVAFQRALYSTLGKILFVDAGSYILTSAITIPSGAKIVGETWSQLVASGSYFENASKPQVLLKVGNVGDIGNVEMQDLLFTTCGATAGLILVQWNIAAASAGSAALWDCHARTGGATGTKLTPAECPPVTSGINQGCSAASLMMHITTLASGYFENMWLWGADHMLDDPDLTSPSNDMVQTSIYIARGFLIESTKASWLYATASEHAVFYQYNFNGASNVFTGMIQTESPYFQPTPPPPAPFAAVVGLFPGDPSYSCATGNEFSGCDESWGVIITKSENIFIAGAGIYSWFSTYAQTCIDTQLCQKALILLTSNKASVRIQNLITIGAKYMAVMDGKGITAVSNLNVKSHPFWSQITILDVGSTGPQFNDLIWIDPALWKMDQPKFTCVPPCHVKIPPWTGATSTVNYPLMTVSSGTWTSTITQAPIIISQWVFEIVTLTQDGTNNKHKRQGFASFIPILATTPFWPSVIYTGVDGATTATAPSIPFPTPPASPLVGSFPKRWWNPEIGIMNDPTVLECTYAFDFSCLPNPYLVGGDGSLTSPGFPDFYDENWEEPLTICPAPSSTTSTTSTSTTKATTTTTIAEQATESPLKQGNPAINKVECYKKGENTEHVRMESAASSFCNSISKSSLKGKMIKSNEYPFAYNGGFGTVTIRISLEILKDTCEFVYDEKTCKQYLSVPTDSCDCGGINNKHGGTVSNNCLQWRIDPELSG